MMRELLWRWFGPRTLRGEFAWLVTEAARSRPHQNPGERLVSHVAWLEAETSNGSLAQYLTNSTGDDFHETVTYLAEIEATRAHSILVELATTIFPQGKVPTNREERCKVFSVWERLPGSVARITALTRRFHEAHGQLLASVVAYAASHREYFPRFARGLTSRCSLRGDDIAVPGKCGHPVPGSRREVGRAGFEDGMEPLGHGAIPVPTSRRS